MERSEDINELATALAKAQGAFRPAIKDSSAKIQSRKEGGANYTYKFADLAAVVECCREALSANGLAVLQPPESSSDGQITIHTILTHSSGQWMASRMELNYQGQDVKQIGSAITYLRRYAFTSFVGVVTDDDDADSAPPMQYRERREEGRYERRDERGPGRPPGRREEGPAPRAPADEAPSREDINRQFPPSGEAAAEPAPPPARPANDKEATKFRGDKIGARGFDVRNWVKLVEDEVGYANQAVLGERIRADLSAMEATSSIQVTRHLIKAARDAGDEETPEPIQADGKFKRVGVGVLGAHLAKLYADPAWREWMRKELRAYIGGKVKEARQVTDNEIYGDRPPPDDDEALGDVESGPADQPAELAHANGTDADWKPGRQ